MWFFEINVLEIYWQKQLQKNVFKNVSNDACNKYKLYDFFSNGIKRFVYKDKRIRERSSYNQDKIKSLNA